MNLLIDRQKNKHLLCGGKFLPQISGLPAEKSPCRSTNGDSQGKCALAWKRTTEQNGYQDRVQLKKCILHVYLLKIGFKNLRTFRPVHFINIYLPYAAQGMSSTYGEQLRDVTLLSPMHNPHFLRLFKFSGVLINYYIQSRVVNHIFQLDYQNGVCVVCHK